MFSLSLKQIGRENNLSILQFFYSHSL